MVWATDVFKHTPNSVLMMVVVFAPSLAYRTRNNMRKKNGHGVYTFEVIVPTAALRRGSDFKDNQTVVGIPGPRRGLPKAVQVDKLTTLSLLLEPHKPSSSY